MNHLVSRVHALCLLAALVATPLATLVISHQRNCATTRPTDMEGVGMKPGLIADGPNSTPWPKARADESAIAPALLADGPNSTPWPKARASESAIAPALLADGPNSTPWPKARLEANGFVG